MVIDLGRGIVNNETLIHALSLTRNAQQEVWRDYSHLDIGNYTGHESIFEGFKPLLKLLAEEHGTSQDRIYLLHGGMHANSIIFDAIGHDGVWLVNDLTYDRSLKALVDRGNRVLGVSMNEHGTDPNDLEATIELVIKETGKPPLAFYSVPRYNNPTAIFVDMNNVHHTAEICHSYGVIPIFDDAYANAGVGLEEEPNKGSLDLSNSFLRYAVVVRLTSKELDPDGKMSWIAGGPYADITPRIMSVATSSLLNGHRGMQAALYKLMESGEYLDHIAWSNREYYQPRGSSLNQGLGEYFGDPERFGFNPILGGSFFTTLWLKDVKDVDTGQAIISAAKDNGAIVTDGTQALAPVDLEYQPLTEKVKVYGNEFGLGINPRSPHIQQVVSQRGFPIRFAPNAVERPDDPYKGVELTRQAVDLVVGK